MTNACKDCTERYYNCHSECAKYLLFKIKKKIRNTNRLHEINYSISNDQATRAERSKLNNGLKSSAYSGGRY